MLLVAGHTLSSSSKSLWLANEQAALIKYLQAVPFVFQVLNFTGDVVGREMPLLDHLFALIADRSDTTVVAANLGNKRLVLLDQILYANQIATCKSKP